MRVRTIRQHANAYPPQYVKNLRRVYEVPDKIGKNLISSGLVEEVREKADEDHDQA